MNLTFTLLWRSFISLSYGLSSVAESWWYLNKLYVLFILVLYHLKGSIICKFILFVCKETLIASLIPVPICFRLSRMHGGTRPIERCFKMWFSLCLYHFEIELFPFECIDCYFLLLYNDWWLFLSVLIYFSNMYICFEIRLIRHLLLLTSFLSWNNKIIFYLIVVL